MIWLNPLAGLALAAIGLPILIHLLVHRRAERMPFPTLRFIVPTRLASIRRRLIDDVPLLALRVAIFALAVAASAGPVVVSPARRASWNARIARAVVVHTGSLAYDAPRDLEERRQAAQREIAGAFRSTVIDTTNLAEGLGQAVSWLETAPPAVREVVCVSGFTIGSVATSAMRAVPADVGIRLVRVSHAPAERVLTGAPILESGYQVRVPAITLRGGETLVREGLGQPAEPRAAQALVVAAAPESKRTVEAAIAAVLAERVPALAGDRTARLVLRGAPELEAVAAGVSPIREPWIADAVASLAANTDLRRAAERVPRGEPETRLKQPPWQVVALAADGRPIAAAAQSGQRLTIMSAAPASSLVTPVLVRAIFEATASPFDVSGAEVVAIPDAQLRAWERPADVPSTPRVSRLDEDDRRWFWGAALLLLAIEGWMRRSRGHADRIAHTEEAVPRVA